MSTKVANLASVSARPSRLRAWRTSIAGFPTTFKIGVCILALVALAGIFAPLLTIYNPTIGDFRGALLPPSIEHPFGTDNIGRDIFARVLYGARVDLQIGFIATYVPFLYGIALGAIAGYVGGWFDTLLMRLIDVIIAFPFIIVIIVIIAILGPGLQNMYIAVFAAGWTIYARLARAEMLVIREQEYILAARALGYGRFRIIFRHALPNLIQSSIVFSMQPRLMMNVLIDSGSCSMFTCAPQVDASGSCPRLEIS
jgi:peptide/nickel transport system permease protein